MRTRTASKGLQRAIALLVTVLVSVGWGCGSEPLRAPISPFSNTAPLPAKYRVSGLVTDEHGEAPFANASVRLWYREKALDTRTDGNGFYEFLFDTTGPYAPPFRIVPAETLGLLAVGGDQNWNPSLDHWIAVHRLPWGDTELVHNVRLRPVRTLAAGRSMALSVEPDSSLIWDRESDPTVVLSFDTLWEEFLVSVPADGTLTINVRPDGDAIPTLLCQYVGCPSFRVQDAVSIPVHPGTLYFNVQIPRGRAPQRFDVQTSLR